MTNQKKKKEEVKLWPRYVQRIQRIVTFWEKQNLEKLFKKIKVEIENTKSCESVYTVIEPYLLFC